MAFFSTHNVRIRGISACIPENRLSNHDLEWTGQDDKTRLIETLGIEMRPVANATTCASDLCVRAAEELIAGLQWDRKDIEALFFVSQTPDYILPGTSFQIQERLGLPKSCACFDINQGCAGYVYGLSLISSFIASSKIKKGLLLVGDTITKLIAPTDQSLTPLFADAGTATALCYDERAAPFCFNLSSEGQNYEAIIVREGGFRYKAGSHDGGLVLKMKGLEVFNFSLKKVIPNIETLLHNCKTSVNAIDYAFFHQANKLILESLGAKLNLEATKVPSSLRDFGNTSVATIPLTMVHHFNQHQIPPSSTVLLSGFGVGLSIGSALLQLEDVYICPLILLP